MSLEQAIIKLVRRFAVIDYPLTAIEIRRWLEISADQYQVALSLDNLVEQRLLSTSSGFYFLSDYKNTVAGRLMRYPESVRKLRLIRQWSRLISFLPWVEGVFIRGSVSFFRAQSASDLDLVIITTTGRLWSARWWLNSLLAILGRRPQAGRSRNRICNALFLTRGNMSLVQTLGGDDWHYFYNHSNFIVSYNPEIMDRFVADNSWLRERLPNWTPYQLNHKQVGVTNYFSRLIKSVGEILAGLLAEDLYHRLQLKIMPGALAQSINRQQYSVVTANLIALHGDSKNIMINEQMRQI